MGAIGGYWPKGTPTKTIVEEVVGQPMLAGVTKSNVFYGVFESQVTGKKMAAVMPISRYQGETAVKLQDETMGPYDTQCPDRLLDMLDEPENDYAKEWREKCRAYNAKIASSKSIKTGTVIELDTPVEFTNGGKAKRFVYTGKTARFYAPELGVTVNLGRNWPTRALTVIKEGGVTPPCKHEQMQQPEWVHSGSTRTLQVTYACQLCGEEFTSPAWSWPEPGTPKVEKGG